MHNARFQPKSNSYQNIALCFLICTALMDCVPEDMLPMILSIYATDSDAKPPTTNEVIISNEHTQAEEVRYRLSLRLLRLWTHICS